MSDQIEGLERRIARLEAALNLIAKWGNPDAETELPAMTARAALSEGQREVHGSEK